MALTVIDILETIRDNASDLYIERVPSVNKENLSQIGDAITSNKNIMNEFVTTLINKVAFSHIKSRMFKNPLAHLKGHDIPSGSTIEEVFINPPKDVGYQADGGLLLKTTKPDGKTAYYSINRKSSYPTTISETMLRQAFKSESDFMQFYNTIITSLYSADEIDEFLLCKNVVGETIDSGAIPIIECDIDNAKDVSKKISTASKSFMFPSTKYCGYNYVNADKITAGETECVTFCNAENQALLIKADAQTSIDYDVLATMFHMEVAKLESITILVDEIPCSDYDIYAVLCDKNCIEIHDFEYKTTDFYNGSNLEFNIWLHHWQTIYFSMFGNAVAFGKKISD